MSAAAMERTTACTQDCACGRQCTCAPRNTPPAFTVQLLGRWSVRLLALLWLLVGLLLALPGCGGSTSEDDEAPAAAEQARIPAQPCTTNPKGCL